jgi:hypothetical protein
MELCKGGTAPRVQLKYLSMFHSRWNSSWICGDNPLALHLSFLSW